MKLTKEILDHHYAGGKFRFAAHTGSFIYTGTLRDYDFNNSTIRATNNVWYVEIEIYYPVKKVKDPVALMQQLVDDGYSVDEDGDWDKGTGVGFLASMWQTCSEEPDPRYGYLPQWLEEAE